MRTEWYGDRRDLVKWGALVHLCSEHNLKSIVQVAFLQESKKPDALLVDDKSAQFPQEVWEHFRDLHHIQHLAKKTGLKIEILDGPFAHEKRQRHCEEVCSTLARINEPKAVLLDPDTGIEPEQANGKHVTVKEIKDIWRVLKTGDWLVLYQHALRQKNWRTKQRQRFAQACSLAKIRTIQAEQIAHDVVFFAAVKP
jgi:hypothetical protein